MGQGSNQYPRKRCDSCGEIEGAALCRLNHPEEKD